MGLLDNLDKISPVKSGGAEKTHGAFLADSGAQKKKNFDEEFALAYNGGTGYVSPPASNVMGFGPTVKSSDQNA